MKNLYLLLILCFSNFLVTAQITTPVIKANFGVEADLSSNYLNANLPDNDDWFGNGLPGNGNFVIDTTGAAALVAGYSNPINRTVPFSRFMSVAPYTTVNNNIWLDAVFHRDFHGDDSTVFASGSNKNGMSPANWSSPASQNIPDKNDILDAYTHIRRAGPDLTDSLWMFGAISIENTTGNRYFDFELYQTDIRFNAPTLSFLGYGADSGHTSWKFDASGNILTAGDIIFSAEYSSSSLSLLQARIWIDKADLLITPVAFSWDGDFDGANNGSTYGYASIIPKTAGSFYTGLQCSSDEWAGSFSLVRADNTVTTTYLAKQFMEFSVNLSKLGLDPVQYGINPCGTPFRRVLIKTRASTSFTAELKDFIAPFSLFNYAAVDAYASTIYFCGTMPNTSINVYNPNMDLLYTWSTTNGNIVGSNTGPVITVNSPGTYFVSQRFDAICPDHTLDSVTILFDAVCAVLNANKLNLQATLNNKHATLTWKNAHNNIATAYELEYSIDNQNFQKIIGMPALADTGIAKYNYVHDLTQITGKAITYRIKVLEKNGVVKYSKSALLRLGNNNILQPIVFPNPSNGKLCIAVQSIDESFTDVIILDVYGRSLQQTKYQMHKGENLLLLNYLENLPSALYVIKVKTSRGESLHKIVLRQ